MKQQGERNAGDLVDRLGLRLSPWSGQHDCSETVWRAPLDEELAAVDELLEHGARLGVRMTFATVGAAAEELPDPSAAHEEFRALHASGHQIASDSLRHERLPHLSTQQLRRSHLRSKLALEQVIGAPGSMCQRRTSIRSPVRSSGAYEPSGARTASTSRTRGKAPTAPPKERLFVQRLGSRVGGSNSSEGAAAIMGRALYIAGGYGVSYLQAMAIDSSEAQLLTALGFRPRRTPTDLWCHPGGAVGTDRFAVQGYDTDQNL